MGPADAFYRLWQEIRHTHIYTQLITDYSEQKKKAVKKKEKVTYFSWLAGDSLERRCQHFFTGVCVCVCVCVCKHISAPWTATVSSQRERGCSRLYIYKLGLSAFFFFLNRGSTV